MAGRDLFAALPPQPTAQPIAQPVTQGRDLFAAQPIALEQPSFPGAAVIEPAATLISGAIAEPIAGLAGLARAAFAPSPEAAVQRGAETIAATREALTFQPRTEAGKEALRTVGGVLAPVGEALQGVETFLGDETFEATGSPALAAAAATIPTALIEAIGFASTRGAIKGAARTKALAKNRAIKKSIVDAAPDRELLRDTSRAVYKELDESGVMIKPQGYEKLVNQIDFSLKEAKFKPRLAKNTDDVLREFKNELGNAQSLSDIDSLRQAAQGAISGIATPNDKRLIGVITDTVDDFLADADPKNFTKGTIKPSEIMPKYRAAQDLWGRAKRSELIEDAFERAGTAKSGFENGLRDEFKRILRNKKQKRFFKPKELEAMKEVVAGTTASNVSKLIGRFGFSEGLATNIIGGSISTTAGAKLLGAPGAVLLPTIGQVSRKLAQKLTRKGADFADAIIRSGDNANDIARVYLSRVPKGQRSASELSELLLRPDIAIEQLGISKNAFMREAAEIAQGQRALRAAGTAATLATPGAIQTQVNQ
ncbi:hypothetical protein KAR91_09975 [Candidatus Pacearchaeota archaeon]|nr:hypothetical protein [Candidatus Pacearchaeota archaeon]